MAAEGKIDIQEHLAKPIDLCLGCRACDIACPVGVPYGHILEVTKEVIAESRPINQKSSSDVLKKTALNHLFPYPKRMNMLGNAVWFYQRTGLYKLVRKTNLINKISKPFATVLKKFFLLLNHLTKNSSGNHFSSKKRNKGTRCYIYGVHHGFYDVSH